MTNLICRPNDIRLAEFIQEAMLMDKFVEIKIHRSTRTTRQNDSLWLWLSQIAQILNEQGQTFTPLGMNIYFHTSVAEIRKAEN